MTSNRAPRTRGVHHVGLTVPDLGETKRFFLETLGLSEVGEVPDYPATFLSDGHVLITLWQVNDPDQAEPFDRTHVVGLHHLALAVENEAELKQLYETIVRTEGAEVEFAPEPLGDGPTQHMMCSIPGGIRVEFIAAAG